MQQDCGASQLLRERADEHLIVHLLLCPLGGQHLNAISCPAHLPFADAALGPLDMAPTAIKLSNEARLKAAVMSAPCMLAAVDCIYA